MRTRQMENNIGNIFKGDKVIWIIFLLLAMISIVEVFSASSGLTYKSHNFIMPFLKHSGTVVLGFFAILVTMNVPCRYFKLLTPILLVVSVVLLILVLFIGNKTGDASRQFYVLGLSVQPSEIAKGTLVLATAQILSALQTENGVSDKAFRYILFITVPIAMLIMVENLSTAVLLCFVILLMMIIGGVPWKQTGKLIAVVATIAVAGVAFIMIVGEDTPTEDEASDTAVTAQIEEPKAESGLARVFHRAGTWKARILRFTRDEDIAPEDYDLDKDAQVAHANIAIVSSNYIGKGPGNSEERDFLAQAFSDFIYAIIIEELGMGGAALVVLLYVLLLFRTAAIAGRCENSFPAFLAMGLALLLVVQAAFNMCVAVGIVPVTGQPLPLISKGGSSTVLNCIYIGMILSVSRTSVQRVPTRKAPVEEGTDDMAESADSNTVSQHAATLPQEA